MRSCLKLFRFSPNAVSAPIRCLGNAQLPNLPVPPLHETLDKYLKSVKPLLTKDEFCQTQSLANEFGQHGGVGEKLQKALEYRASVTENWLAKWWLNTAYLEFRSSVVVFSSPGLVFPRQKFANEQQRLKYTAQLISAALDFKRLLERGKIKQEKMGEFPLDMSQYHHVFGTCRLPQLQQDRVSFNPKSRHIVVLHNNNMFKIVVYHGESETKEYLSEDEILDQLTQLTNDSQHAGPAVGILSANDRDSWANAYTMLQQDAENCNSLQALEQALFVVCLDKAVKQSCIHESCYVNMTTDGLQLVHGGGCSQNSANRWFDKTIQFVIGEEGGVGLTYEHSPAEGQPIAAMMDHIVNYISAKKESQQSSSMRTCKKPQKLTFCVNDSINEAISSACKYVDSLVGDLEMCNFKFIGYGKDFIKSHKLSPDSYIQMAMQYAFYRLHGVPGAHYESAATRMFFHGRTETIRSCSVESVGFAQAMLDSSTSPLQKINALKMAVKAHKDYTIMALKGLGVDRHLLGLKMAAKECEIQLPKLFTDNGFIKSSHMRISTSQVASKCDGFMVYGPHVPDGYGCCYNPREKDINFGVSAFASCPETSAVAFRQSLEDALCEMQHLLDTTPLAKL